MVHISKIFILHYFIGIKSPDSYVLSWLLHVINYKSGVIKILKSFANSPPNPKPNLSSLFYEFKYVYYERVNLSFFVL